MKKLLLLHGALGCKEQFNSIATHLSKDFEVHRLNFEGHGQSGRTGSPFRISYFVENVLGYLEEHNIEQVNIFGYSMGGYVALSMALSYPTRINKIATLGTILQWNEEIAERECHYLYPEKIKEKVPHFADTLNRHHPDGWERVVNRTREMLLHLGREPAIESHQWHELTHPIRFHLGDRDNTAGMEATTKIYRKIDQAELHVIPASAHPIEEVKVDILATSLMDFF